MADGDQQAVSDRAAVREKVGALLFSQDYQRACNHLDGLSMDDLLGVLDGLYVTYPFNPLISFTSQAATGVFKGRLLAALYAVSGADESKITPLIGLLPPAQQETIRSRLAARRADKAAGSALAYPGLLPGNSLLISPGPPIPAPLPTDEEFVNSIPNGITTATDGPPRVTHGPASLSLSVSGLTGSLKGGGAVASLQAGPTGSVTLSTSYRNASFKATLTADRWDMQLTFNLTDPIPNLLQLNKIFGEGEQALKNTVGEVSKFSNLTVNDIPRIKDAIKPHTRPIKDAIDAATAISAASAAAPYRPIIGFSASGPGLGATPGAPGVPQGVEVRGTITIFF